MLISIEYSYRVVRLFLAGGRPPIIPPLQSVTRFVPGYAYREGGGAFLFLAIVFNLNNCYSREIRVSSWTVELYMKRGRVILRVSFVGFRTRRNEIFNGSNLQRERGGNVAI